MPCDFDRIDALLDGSSDEAARRSVLTHIEACSTCRAYWEAMQTLECDAAPSADFSRRVMEQVRATPQQKKRAASYRRVLAGLAACAVLVLGLRLLAFRQQVHERLVLVEGPVGLGGDVLGDAAH